MEVGGVSARKTRMGRNMLTDGDFARDAEFLKMLARRDDVHLTTAALEIARDAYPGFDFSTVHDWISDRAREISSAILQATDEENALGLLTHCLANEQQLMGCREAYSHADSSYLNRVIETRRGIPISLSVLYVAVANQAGLALHGVAAPGHFMTRYDGISGPLFVDAFDGGEILTLDQMLLRVRLTTGMTEERAIQTLEPADPRTIIVRMLNNLKALYSEQANWDAAWLVQRRLAALQPASHDERRDLGLISLRANRPGVAIDLLERCLKSADKTEVPVLEAQLIEAQRQLAEWN
jgi:regulator of sirC expression with transglutaminase-like and TPR domain